MMMYVLKYNTKTINYALEIKKDVVIIKDSDFKLTHGMDMQLANVPTFIFDKKTIDEKFQQLRYN